MGDFERFWLTAHVSWGQFGPIRNPLTGTALGLVPVRMVKKPRRLRASLLLLSSLALPLTVGRCSPISMSVQKGMHSPSPFLGGTSLPVITQQSEDHLKNQDAPLLDWDGYQSATAHLPSGQTLALPQIVPVHQNMRSTQYSASLDDKAGQSPWTGFKQNHQIAVQYNGGAPTECKIFLGLSPSSACIAQDFGVKNFKTDCVPTKDHQLQITVTNASVNGNWDLLTSCLEGMTVYIGSNLQLNAIGMRLDPANGADTGVFPATQSESIDGGTGTR
jgi:hypothetical protein